MIKGNKYLSKLEKAVQKGEPQVNVTGLAGTALSYFLSCFLTDFDRPSLIVLPDKKDALRLIKELRFFMSRFCDPESTEHMRLFEFPAYNVSPLTGLSPNREVIAKRIQALYALVSNKNPVVVTSLDNLFFRIMPKQALVDFTEYIETEEEIDRDSLLRKLEIGGYQRVSLVEYWGDYSVRGGIIDIFSPMYSLPIRLEFWGDRLESIRSFDPVSQRSVQHFKNAIILPALEIITDDENVKRARLKGRLPVQDKETWRFSGQEAWLNHFFEHPDILFDYVPDNCLLTLVRHHLTPRIFEKTKKKYKAEIDKYSREASLQSVPFPDTAGLMVEYEDIVEEIEPYQQLHLDALPLDPETDNGATIHITGRFELEDDLHLSLSDKKKISLAPLVEKISLWLDMRARVVLVCRTEKQAARLQELLATYNRFQVNKTVSSWSEVPEGPGLYMCIGNLSKGFVYEEIGLFVISEDEIFGAKKAYSRRKTKTHKDALAWSSFSQLRSGDFIVHEEHGIGQYHGLVKIEMDNRVNEFVLIHYADNAKLYIPADRVSVLQKYAGVDDREPVLDQLGGHSWRLVKQKAKKAVARIAKQLVEIYALRSYKKGYAFSPPDHYFREFEATFEHEETEDQIKAIEDVLDDMTSEKPMDRLICGDVGFGKTEVAIRAAFKAVSDGKQVGIVVPTTVLAEQHFQTFKKRMDPFGVRIGILSRFKTIRQQSEILAKLRSGQIDIVIGTHRLLQKDVRFADMGLLIIDEEQRFGVKQKELLKKYRATVDVLAITATPIPRTLHLSLMGVCDLSVIETPPADRLSIQTVLSKYDTDLIRKAITNELARSGQVFFVHNRVYDIDVVTSRLRQIVPEARIGVAHGQMKKRDLEKTMLDFLDRKIDVLVCTSIIESGLDIPSANTIIIDQAEQLGLAQIYQLRGRVGRSDKKSYAYLLVSDGAKLTKDAEKRLRALIDFSHLGAGLHLAMHDLKIRGGGNILGFSQSGHISSIGYELYLKLVERTVAELKGEEWHDDINPEINMDISAYLPGDYIIDTDVRLNLYRRLSSLVETTELLAMQEEIKDRFGPPPKEVENLFGLMSLRILLKQLYITKLDVGPKTVSVTFADNHEMDAEHIVNLIHRRPDKYRLLSDNKLSIRMGKMSKHLDKIYKEVEAIQPVKRRLSDIS